MTQHLVSRTAAGLLLLLVGAPVVPASATWSIAAADRDSREVAVGTITCLNNFDLLALVTVVAVEKGAGAVQSAGDFDGVRRPVIFEELLDGTPPEEILEILSGIAGHDNRQYGIADTQHRAVSFSGPSNGAWAGGRTFVIGSTIYAIQGNVLAGQCVIDAIEFAIEAVRTAGGDIPEQLMAGMEAAAEAGGDGRCSCDASDPEMCGCPVETFDKSGHIGGMVVARVGDTDDDDCDVDGCADGDYFMRLNVAFQPNEAPDPAVQLREQFDGWRAKHVGRPDAVHSAVAYDPPFVAPNGVSTMTLTVYLRDWNDAAATAGIDALTVQHAPGSAGLATIGPVTDNGDGSFDVELTAGNAAGVDRFTIVADDGLRPVTLTPEPQLIHYELGDADGNGVVDYADVILLLTSWGPCPDGPAACPADIDGSGGVDGDDVMLVLGGWSTRGACCFDDGACAVLGPFRCVLDGGAFLGEGTSCADACPLGACCLPEERCSLVPEARCAAMGGWFQGVDTACDGVLCRNDDCAGAVRVNEGVFPFSTIEATSDGPTSLPAECDEGNGVRFLKDVWFHYTATCDGTATASVCDADFDTNLAIHDDTACPGVLFACSDDACGENGTRSSVSFPVTAGTSYRVRIGGRSATGEGTLVIDCAP